MTDAIRDLLISLASHMAYMQGQLEARHGLDDFEDFYWYRESVLLRQKVTDALADGPVVLDGREPVSFTGRFTFPATERPSNEELALIYHDCCGGCEFMDQGGFEDAARAVLARWGNAAPQPPADGEVAELVRMLTGIAHWRRRGRPGEGDPSPFDIRQADRLDRAADLLQRLSPPQPVPVSERLPGPEDCDAAGRCWWHRYTPTPEWYLRFGRTGQHNHWLPAHALPVPGQEVEG